MHTVVAVQDGKICMTKLNAARYFFQFVFCQFALFCCNIFCVPGALGQELFFSPLAYYCAGYSVAARRRRKRISSKHDTVASRHQRPHQFAPPSLLSSPHSPATAYRCLFVASKRPFLSLSSSLSPEEAGREGGRRMDLLSLLATSPTTVIDHAFLLWRGGESGKGGGGGGGGRRFTLSGFVCRPLMFFPLFSSFFPGDGENEEEEGG